MISENFYPNPIRVFYVNLTIENNILFSWVNSIDIKMSCADLAKILEIDNEGLDIFSETLKTFDKFRGDHFRIIASTLIHDDPNPSLIVNDNVELFTPLSSNC